MSTHGTDDWITCLDLILYKVVVLPGAAGIEEETNNLSETLDKQER